MFFFESLFEFRFGILSPNSVNNASIYNGCSNFFRFQNMVCYFVFNFATVVDGYQVISRKQVRINTLVQLFFQSLCLFNYPFQMSCVMTLFFLLQRNSYILDIKGVTAAHSCRSSSCLFGLIPAFSLA